MTSQMSTARVFDELWARYDSWFERNRIIAFNEARLIKSLVSEDKRPLVEIGVGTGFFSESVRAEAGIDPSFKMLLRARERGISLLVRAVGERLPFKDRVFGTVIIVVTLCFVDEPLRVLREAYRVLYRGGELISCIIPRESPWGMVYRRKAEEGNPFYSLARFYSREEARSLIRKAGFAIVEERGVLSFKPGEEPRIEDPSPWNGSQGFLCIKALKTGR